MRKEDLLMKSLYEANIWHGFSIINTQTDGDEIFSFVTQRKNECITNFYINCLDVLNYFIVYFKSKAFDLIDTSDQKKLAVLRKTMTAQSFQIEDNFSERVQNFMNDVHIDKFVIDTEMGPKHLSKREFDCLFKLSQGKSGKEIANELSISPRTVETHLNKIKCKTGLLLRSDLVKLLDGIVSRQEILIKHTQGASAVIE
ncbi:MAG: helix-turn-helix transcriptional regulator [Pseudomonadota bacterium]